ncbi:butyrophilin subfamily 2 member A1-like isoform X2 [Oryzias latipes]
MSVRVFCVFLCISGCFRGSSAGIQNITKKPGDDVTLMCEDPEKKEISLLECRRKDSEIVFLFKDGRPIPSVTDESFRNRVFLKDSQMKDGDLSVVLKNVTINDSGTYKCGVLHGNDPSGDPLILICTIHLSVVPPGDPSPGHEDGGSRGLLGLIALPVLAVVLVLLLWIYKKKSRRFSGESSDKKIDDL